ncbi:hypothetical protein HKCCE2091_13105 [Rhodobacterales bacterium HKCCE2091]|nr:hypothetical protein [Rhodobacterales bacterium HKCCE2091]
MALPWGAYARTWAVPGDDRAAATELSVPQVAVADRAHRCRIGTLPGNGCGPDLALPAEPAGRPSAALSAGHPRNAQWAVAALTPAPPRGPPRA